MNSRSVIGSMTGRALRAAGALPFKGKGRLVHHWLQHRDPRYVGTRALDGGGRMICGFDVPYEAMVWAHQEEERELHVLKSLLSPGEHFVDCGANVGLWSLVAAGRVGAAGRVTAFEPNPAAHERLIQNIAASGAVGARITVLNVAVAAQPGFVSFETGKQHNLGHVVAGSGGTATCIRVPAVSLDDELGEVAIRVLKLDIEGGEAPALRGAARILRSQRPWVVAEFNVAANGTERIGDWEVFTLLREHGYDCRRIGSSAPAGAPIAADETFSGYVNVLFEPPHA
jgi:FkbM family methyltransferase